MQLRRKALGEAELVVKESIPVLELTGINLSVQQLKLGSHLLLALAFLGESYTEEDREQTDLSIHFQAPEEPIRIPDVMLGSLHAC